MNSDIEIEKRFWDFCKAVQAEDEKDYGITPELGKALHNVLLHVMENPDHETFFKDCFIRIGLNENDYTEWLLLYCMRELRYPEVQVAIYNKFHDLGGTEGAPGLMNYVSHVSWVYDDAPWEDADFFKYYWEKEHPGKPWPMETNNA